MNTIQKPTSENITVSSSSAKVLPRNNRKIKTSFFSRLTKRQKTTEQTLSSLDDMDQMLILNFGEPASSQKGAIPIMSVVDNTPPSLQSLCSSQSSDDTQSNHEKMLEAAASSKQTISLYASGARNFAELDAEFLEARADRWRVEGKSFADLLESSAQFSMSMDVDEKNDTLEQTVQQQDEKRRGKKVTFGANLRSPLDTTSDSVPLPVLSSKQKESVEPTLFELDSSLLSALSAINPVEESFSDEESRESQDENESDLQELDVDEPDDLPAADDLQNDDDLQEDEHSAEGFNVFSFDYMQERLSCIGCV